MQWIYVQQFIYIIQEGFSMIADCFLVDAYSLELTDVYSS